MSLDAAKFASAAVLAPYAFPFDTPELALRGQFILGSYCVARLRAWKRCRVAGDRWLMTHPDLPVTQVAGGRRSLTLIGYMLDPANVLATDDAILTRLLDACSSIAALTAATAPIGGRWVLVAGCDNGTFVFNDALGLRQVFCTDPAHTADVWVMSQAGLGAEYLDLEPDAEAMEFMDSYVVRTRAEYHWPAASAPVRGLRHLLPNHYVNMQSGAIARFWPTAPLEPMSFDEGVERLTTILPGLVQAAAARFDLALALTAGLDSRLVLAASRPFSEEIRYVTVRQAKMHDDNADIMVASRLSAALGLRHDVIRAHSSMSAEFSRVYKARVYGAHDHYGADAEAILRHYGRRKVAVTGSGAEVGRCSFRQRMPFSDWRRIRAEDLAWLEHMEHPFAIRHFETWLDDVGENSPVKVLDLLEWEQGHGSWLAMTQLEFDIAWRDILTPYNCRELLAALLAVRETHRRAPEYRLFKAAIQELWPDVLCQPINPSGQRRGPGYWMGQARLRAKAYARWWSQYRGPVYR
jgi:hypothetical protein